MHPVLFEIPLFGGIPIRSYGFFMALGFLAAVIWIRYQSKRVKLDPNQMTDLAFWMMLTALIGSRIAHVIYNWSHYSGQWFNVIDFRKGGYVFQGGLIACVIVAWFYLKKYKLSFWKISDLFMPGVAIGHAFGRIGCFMAGCCHGRACDPHAWYGVTFPDHPLGSAPPGVALYPTQLIESGAEFLIFLFLAWRSKKKAFDGQILLLYLITYSVVRFLIELLRGDERGWIIKNFLSPAQLIGIGCILVGILILVFRRQKGRS